jgi:hypothetical protein
MQKLTAQPGGGGLRNPYRVYKYDLMAIATQISGTDVIRTYDLPVGRKFARNCPG